MAKFVFIYGALLLFTSAFAWQRSHFQPIECTTFIDTIPVKDVQEDTATIITKAEKEPRFEDDDDDNEAWYRFLLKNMVASVPVDNGAPAGRYKVVIRFVVEKDGSVTNIKALTKHGYGMEAEVIRVIELSGKWIPATQNGRIVRCYKEQPFTFEVHES